MPIGLRIRNPSDGALIMDEETRVATNIALVAIGKTNGSYTVTSIGTPCYVLASNSSSQYQPTITISGQTITWTWPVSGATYNNTFTMFVGVH